MSKARGAVLGFLSRLPGRGGWRVATPTMLQMKSAECGAACLGMVLGFYGRHEPLEKLRDACGVARDGAKVSNVLKAAQAYGLVAKGFARKLRNLPRVPRPFVALWSFTHFVVVEGFGPGGRVYVNDPASGPRVVSEHELREAYSGVVLAFQPGEGFVRTKKPPGTLRSLYERTRRSWRGVLFVALVSLALFVPGLLVPAFSRVYVDFYLIEDQTRWLPPLLALMFLTALFTGFLSWLLDNGLTRFYSKLQTTWSGQMVWHVLRLPVSYFAHRSGGDISTRIQSNGWLAWLIAGELSSTFLGLTTLAVYAFVMAQYDVNLTLVVVVFAALDAVAFLVLSRRLADKNREKHRDKGKAMGSLMQGLRSIDTYQASGTEALFFRQWAGHYAKVTNASQSIGKSHAFLSATPPLLGLLSTTATLVVGGYRIMQGSLTIGMLVAFQGLVAAFSLPVKRVVDAAAQMQEAQGLLARMDDVLRQEVDSEFARGMGKRSTIAPMVTNQKLGGTLELRGVTFGFSPLDEPLIRGFDLHLRPGARIALVGPSGSGKTTLGRLISGILVPWSGQILIDGHPLADIPRDVFRNTVAVVDQDIALFEGTVAQNVTMWDPTLGGARMVQAAKDACLHQVIAARPGGYRQKIEEGGRNFSGGERQRIEIARALIHEPSLLILDEATSSLDAQTEVEIIENLRRRGCTSILIAHRLSTIRDCDEIVVLDQGRVAERGTHLELMERDGLYRALVES